MQFTDLIFLLMFLPVALIIFYIAGNKVKPWILLVFNLFFYALCQLDFLLILCILTIINTGFALWVGTDTNKHIRFFLLLAGISLNIALLTFYKYSDSVLLPLGLSFYTFKAISVLSDSYMGKITISTPIAVVNYLLFFGQIQSGPITRYEDGSFAKFIEGGGRLLTDGVERFLVGFNKKVLLANILVKITDEIFAYENPSLPYAWLGAVCFSLQLYYDFSGYSDMAIGISNMFGIPCVENFNYPYATASIAEFWRRWHISLGKWFRDYVYIPLGGSRVRSKRMILNLGIVWILTGIWHGSTGGFVLWGMAYFVLIAFEKFTGCPEKFKHRMSRVLYKVYSLIMINFLWVVFYYGHTALALRYIKSMLIPSIGDISVKRAGFLLTDYGVFIAAAIIFATPIVPAVMRLCQRRKSTEVIYHIAYGVVVAGLFMMSLAMVVSGESNPFLYIGF